MSTDFKITEGAAIISESTVYQVLEISNVDANCAVLARCRVEETGNIFDLKCIPTKHLLNYKHEAKVLHYLKDRYPGESNFVKIIETFGFQDWFCFVFEKLDMRLSDFVKSRANKRFSMQEIKVFARQMLTALTDLENVGIIHMNIKPENIIVVNDESQTFRVKLTGFDGAGKTSMLSQMTIPKNCGYSAPEVLLQCQLDEKVAIWSVGMTLAFIFLGHPLYPTCCDYEYMRKIVEVNGLPHRKYLDQGECTDHFFTPDSDWSLQTPEEYLQKSGRQVCCGNSFYKDFKFLSCLILEVGIQYHNFEEVIAFIQLLKKMLFVNPEDRISPAEALNYNFVREDFSTSSRETSGRDLGTPGNVSDEENNYTEEDLIIHEGVTFGFESEYYLEEFLATGFIGTVAKCKKVETEEDLAVKIFDKVVREYGEQEVEILKAISSLDPDKNHIIRFIDSFTDRGVLFIVQELLDEDFINFLRQRECKPLTLAEIRPIAEQMFVTLKALKSIGITHSDIKPDNLMLVNHDSQPFKVKLIDFGFAYRTGGSPETSLVQNEMYRAPEVYFGLPHDEGIDMWSVGCMMVFLFKSQHLFSLCEYENVKRIIKLCGLPEKDLLDKGLRVRLFFTKLHNGSDDSWRINTREEYELATGEITEPWDETIESLDDLLKWVSEEENPTEFQDLKSFIDLLKKILVVNPAKRILPEDALKHPFITMEHLSGTNSYVTESLKILQLCQLTSQYSDTEKDNDESDLGQTGSENEMKISKVKLEKDRIPSDDAKSDPVTIESLPYTSIRSRMTGGAKTPAGNQLFMFSDSEDDEDKSALHKMQTSPLKLEKGVQIIHQSDIYRIEVVGSGVFAKVVKCSIKGTDKMVAVKIFRKDVHRDAIEEINVYCNLKTLNSDENNIIKFIKCFMYKDCICLVFELYHSSLFEFVKKRHWKALRVDEIRPIAQQMLVTLRGLKSIGVVHSDIKPDNIMQVKNDLQPFEVKLINFGLAFGTSNLSVFRKVQPDGYRAPEVYLGLPYDESIDMWGLGCTLAFMYLATHLFPENDYQVMTVIVNLCGLPDEKALHESKHVKDFFILEPFQSRNYWRLKTMREYVRDTGKLCYPLDPFYNNLFSLDDLVEMANEENKAGLEDSKAFIDLLKKMLEVDPADRITPDEALKHPFITKEPLPCTSLMSRVTKADEIPSENQLTNADCGTEGDKDESTLNVTESEHGMETSTLNLKKGVKILNESDVYLIEDVLGCGCESYGQRVKCRKEGSDKLVDVKVVRKQNYLKAIREVNSYDSLSKVNSQGMTYTDCFIFKDCFCIVYEQ
nr:uncharacterized protein LOC129153115 [Nothobranchius furzeri]